jgi:hypothetical protein
MLLLSQEIWDSVVGIMTRLQAQWLRKLGSIPDSILQNIRKVLSTGSGYSPNLAPCKHSNELPSSLKVEHLLRSFGNVKYSRKI